MAEDFLAPLTRYLRSDPKLRSMMTEVVDPFTTPILGPPEADSSSLPWIFRSADESDPPPANVEGTGRCSITLSHGDNWARKNRGHHLMFPSVTVHYHCDVTRDTTIHAPLLYDARDKCYTLHKEVTRLLHIINKGVGGFLYVGADDEGNNALRLESSTSGRDLTVVKVANGDGLVHGRATFELAILP